MNLKESYRQVGFRSPYLMVEKSSREPKDVFKLIKAYEEKDGQLYAVMLGDIRKIEEIINDKNITKLYFSDEIKPSKKYLGLMILGLEYIMMTAQFDDIEEAKQMIQDKIEEETKDILQ